MGGWVCVGRGRVGSGCLLEPSLDPFLDAGEVAIFGSGGKAGAYGIEVDVDHASGDGGVIEEGLAFEARFPETALDVVFFVGGAGNELVEAAHEPAEVAQSPAEGSDAIGTKGQSADFEVEGRGGLSFGSATGREEGEPTGGDFPIGPGGDEVGAKAQDGMVVIHHDGVGADLDGENGGEIAQAAGDPDFTVGKIAAREGVESIEESAADASAEAVIDTFLSFLDIFAAWQGHGSPLSICLMANP